MVADQIGQRRGFFIRHPQQGNLDPVKSQIGHDAQDRYDLIGPTRHPETGMNSELHVITHRHCGGKLIWIVCPAAIPSTRSGLKTASSSVSPTLSLSRVWVPM